MSSAEFEAQFNLFMRSLRTAPLRSMATVAMGPLLCLLSSCLPSKIQTEVPAFAKAVTETTMNTKAAFEVVEQKYEEAQAFTLVVNYKPGQRFDPASVKFLLSEEDLEARMKLLAGLQQYGTQLEAVAGGAAAGKVDQSSKQLGASLKSLAPSVAIKKMATNAIYTGGANAAAAAIDALGNWLIQEKLRKNLPGLIASMQEPIAAISDLFKADIGSVNADGEGHGLRFALWMTYTQLIQKQQEFLTANFKELTPEHRTAEIEKLPAMVRARRLADQTLAQTEAGLDLLVKANAQLLDAVKTKTTMHTQIDALQAEGSRIGEFYRSLNAAK